MAAKKHSGKSKDGSSNPAPWIAGALFVLGLAVLAGVYLNRNVAVKQVVYHGLHFVEQADLEKKLEVPVGISPDSLNFMAIVEKAERVPYVQQAAVNVEPGGNLEIEVRERAPIALLTDGPRKRYVDSTGILLPVIPGKAVDVPIVYGFDLDSPAADTLESSSWRSARAFLLELRKHPFYDATVSEVAWTDDEGIVALSHENGVKLIFGSRDFDTKLRNWKAFYSEIIREKGIDRMRTVDLRFEGQIVTRER